MTLFFSVLQVTYLIISVLTKMCHSQRMLPVFSTCCVEMVTRWENLMSHEASSEIDVWPEFQNLTGDAISRTAFGSSYQEGRSRAGPVVLAGGAAALGPQMAGAPCHVRM